MAEPLVGQAPPAQAQPVGPARGSPAPAVLAATGVAVLLALVFLVAPPMGTDLSAQVARANFVDRYGWAPVDFGWYGGISPYGYSLLVPSLGAAVGVRPLGALAAVVAAGAFGWLLARHEAGRPVLGGVLGAVVLVGNVASGRVTFAVGLALGLLALCAVSARRPPRVACLAGAGLCAALATWASPVAGLFTGLAGAALLLAAGLPAGRRGGRWPEFLALGAVPAVALVPLALLFGNGGRQPYTAESMRINVALAVLAAVVLPRQQRVLRWGAALTALLLVAAYYLPSPIGSNVLRLPMLFALPLLAGYAALPGRWLAALLAALLWWQSPVMTSDLIRAGSAESRSQFYRPLVDELARREPVGRVEVVPLRDHWESVYLPPTAPLARGWERQVDAERNPIFYRRGLDGAGYVEWLRANAVSYVAIAPGSPPDRYGQEEAALVLAGVPGLREVWRNETWRLYGVIQPAPLVSAPGRLLSSDPGGVRFAVPDVVPEAGAGVRAGAVDLPVRVRWSRWLSLAGPAGCLAAGPDGWVVVRGAVPGEYRLGSALRPAGRC
jgi:hypothetical protein